MLNHEQLNQYYQKVRFGKAPRSATNHTFSLYSVVEVEINVPPFAYLEMFQNNFKYQTFKLFSVFLSC